MDEALQRLLSEFGPPRKSLHPEYPFWRLQNDEVWTVQARGIPQPRSGNTDPRKSELLKHEAYGGFTEEIYKLLCRDPALIAEAARRLLTGHFPESIHSEILSAVGLPENAKFVQARARNPGFREEVIRAYRRKCAVCGFDVRLGNSDLALEAAHIKWHQVGGPDQVSNGVCLCVLHHRLFDRGALGISHDGRILVSEDVHGSIGMHEWLLKFEGRLLQSPQRTEYYPTTEFVGWHLKEVFRGPSRKK